MRTEANHRERRLVRSGAIEVAHPDGDVPRGRLVSIEWRLLRIRYTLDDACLPAAVGVERQRKAVARLDRPNSAASASLPTSSPGGLTDTSAALARPNAPERPILSVRVDESLTEAKKLEGRFRLSPERVRRPRMITRIVV